MKKILAILTCALMGFTLAACSSKNKINEDALDAYAKAATNITKMKSAAYDMKLLVDADDMDMHAKVTMDGTYNAEKKLQLALHMDAAVNGIGLDDRSEQAPPAFAYPARDTARYHCRIRDSNSVPASYIRRYGISAVYHPCDRTSPPHSADTLRHGRSRYSEGSIQ